MSFLFRRLPLALGAASLLLLAAAPQTPPPTLELPQIGEPADNSLSPADERELGDKIVAEIYSGDYVLEDPELAEYVAGLGWKLAAHSSEKPIGLHFFVIKDPRINAFALPGGYIGINAGLLLASSNESELAGVLAHELAHVTQRHIARTIEGTQAATLATWAAVLAAIIAGSANPDIVLAALSLGQAANYQRQVNFTRAHELEADRLGIRTMADAGFQAEGMASFFQRLEQQSRLYGSGLPEILRTHPVNTTRIAEARTRAAQYAGRPRTDPVEFGLMRARARVLTADRPSQAVEYFVGQLEASPESVANRYGLAVAQTRLGQYERARETLLPALQSLPRQPGLNLQLARIQLALQQPQEARATLARTLELYPRYAPAILEFADTLITLGRPEAARETLLAREQALGTRMETYRLLASAAREMGNVAEAHYQMASYLQVRHDYGGALSQLDAGLRLSDLTPDERARLAARRAEIKDALPKDFRPDRPEDRKIYEALISFPSTIQR